MAHDNDKTFDIFFYDLCTCNKKAHVIFNVLYFTVHICVCSGRTRGVDQAPTYFFYENKVMGGKTIYSESSIFSLGHNFVRKLLDQD